MTSKVIFFFYYSISVPIFKYPPSQEVLTCILKHALAQQFMGVSLVVEVQSRAGRMLSLARRITHLEVHRGQGGSINEWTVPALGALFHCFWNAGSPRPGVCPHGLDRGIYREMSQPQAGQWHQNDNTRMATNSRQETECTQGRGGMTKWESACPI